MMVRCARVTNNNWNLVGRWFCALRRCECSHLLYWFSGLSIGGRNVRIHRHIRGLCYKQTSMAASVCVFYCNLINAHKIEMFIGCWTHTSRIFLFSAVFKMILFPDAMRTMIVCNIIVYLRIYSTLSNRIYTNYDIFLWFCLCNTCK